MGHEGGRPLTEQLRRLFESVRPKGRTWTNQEVADELKVINPSLRVSGSYLSSLRTGKRTNPSTELLTALAKFFGISPAYFFDDEYAERVNSQLAALRALDQSGVRAVALRAEGLSAENLAIVRVVLDQVRKAQGLPPLEE
ncbi:helix-turn-helix transcriptional regulator [Saccharothrix xinjiangensis]|uniref:Helix-turn-helix domain-containing protein n=1 Tax=Saccharothrix xinjiangensis TaxID=204798 RepID=A0ABV9Y5Z4_9PSEU